MSNYELISSIAGDSSLIRRPYYKMLGAQTEVGADWNTNIKRNHEIIMSCSTPEELINIQTNRGDFSIDGFITWAHVEHLIEPAIAWESEKYPQVVYSTISKYFNPAVVRNGLSVNHCETNIRRHIIDQHHHLQDRCTHLKVHCSPTKSSYSKEFFQLR